MLILQYYKIIKKLRIVISLSAILPDPRGPLLEKVPTDAILSANVAVVEAITKSETSQNKGYA